MALLVFVLWAAEPTDETASGGDTRSDHSSTGLSSGHVSGRNCMFCSDWRDGSEGNDGRRLQKPLGFSLQEKAAAKPVDLAQLEGKRVVVLPFSAAGSRDRRRRQPCR